MVFEKLEFGSIDDLIKLIGLGEFQLLLWNKVRGAFNESFQTTQEEFDFRRTKPDSNALEYLKQRQFILSQKTIDRLHGDLRLNLLEGIQNNYSIKEMVEQIRPIFDHMKDYELERIARTETLNAMNSGRLNAYEKSGIVKYIQWKSHKDARTSEICKRLDGQIVKIGELFTDPKTGEQFRNPPAHPNCRSGILPLRKLPEITYKSGYKYMAKIEIDIGSLIKQEKHYEYVTVHLKNGKTFKRKQLVGRKEKSKEFEGSSKKQQPEPKKGSANIDKKELIQRMNFYQSGLKFHPEGEKMITEVDEYTGVNYASLNAYLREDKVGTNKEYNEKINYISTFLKYAPKMGGGVVYRGMGFSKSKKDSSRQFEDFLSNLKEGGSFRFKSFTSTSLNEEVAMKFAKENAAHSIVFKIIPKSGVYLDGVSQLQDEDEVLFDKDSTFKVHQIDRSGYPEHVGVLLEEV